MSEHVEGLNINQTALFPDTLEDYVDKENPARFIDAFVDSLNLEKLGFKHSVPAEVGRPSTTRGSSKTLCLRIPESGSFKQKAGT